MSWVYQLLLIVVAACEVSVAEFSLNKYHSHEELTTFLCDLAKQNPGITKLYSIGTSVEGRELWVVEISAGEDKSLRPNVKLVGNIHGNEAVGREILMQLSKFLVESYKSGDERIRRLLDFGRVHILPSLNPDGFQLALNYSKWGGDNQCTSSAGTGRRNKNDLDLNRNFPDPNYSPRGSIQSETQAVVDWLRNVPFVLSAALHGGAMVASYPYDGRKKDASKANEPNLTPDDDVFKHLALGYARRHPVMHKGEACPRLDAQSFPQGVTNGAAWYPLPGGMQDYNYIQHGCMELTLEISCCKYPNATDLHHYWEDNKEELVGASIIGSSTFYILDRHNLVYLSSKIQGCLSLLSFLEEVRRGIRGVVVDEEGAPIPNATLYVKGRDMLFHTTKRGEFSRILLPNSYLLQVDADGFQPRTIPIQIDEPKLNEWSQFINVTLYRKQLTEIENDRALWSEITLY